MGAPPLHILLIEDDDVDQEYILRGLHRHARHIEQITVTRTAVEALHLLRHQAPPPLGTPYVILLALYLPGVSGFEFLNELRQDAALKASLVFVVTGSDDAQEQARADA